MSKYQQTLCALGTFISLAMSDCTTSNGCSSSASCDVEFVAERVYGCGGVWGDNMRGIASAEFLCADGYSICPTMSWAATLGLTKELCLSNTLMTANYFYASLQSSSAATNCDATGVNDVFGCASSDSDSFVWFGDSSFPINCGPFGAQLSTESNSATNFAWRWGWEFDHSTEGQASELTTTYHWYSKQESSPGANDWAYTSTATGGVVCCIDELPVDTDMMMNTTDIWYDTTEMTDFVSTQQYTSTEIVIETQTGTTEEGDSTDNVGRCSLSVLVAVVLVLTMFAAVL